MGQVANREGVEALAARRVALPRRWPPTGILYFAGTADDIPSPIASPAAYAFGSNAPSRRGGHMRVFAVTRKEHYQSTRKGPNCSPSTKPRERLWPTGNAD
jgi:hypothetical protein